MKSNRKKQRKELHFSAKGNTAINKKKFYAYWFIDYVFSFLLILSLFLLLGNIDKGILIINRLLLAVLIGLTIFQFLSMSSGAYAPRSDENQNINVKEKVMFYYDTVIIKIAFLSIMLKFIGMDMLFYCIFVTTFLISMFVKLYIGFMYIKPEHIVFTKCPDVNLGKTILNHKMKIIFLLMCFGIFIVMPGVFVTVFTVANYYEIIMIGIVVSVLVGFIADGIDSIINSLSGDKETKQKYVN